jgi:hypothetical protein
MLTNRVLDGLWHHGDPKLLFAALSVGKRKNPRFRRDDL